jgi:hypothetical protein
LRLNGSMSSCAGVRELKDDRPTQQLVSDFSGYKCTSVTESSCWVLCRGTSFCAICWCRGASTLIGVYVCASLTKETVFHGAVRHATAFRWAEGACGAGSDLCDSGMVRVFVVLVAGVAVMSPNCNTEMRSCSILLI